MKPGRGSFLGEERMALLGRHLADSLRLARHKKQPPAMR